MHFPPEGREEIPGLPKVVPLRTALFRWERLRALPKMLPLFALLLYRAGLGTAPSLILLLALTGAIDTTHDCTPAKTSAELYAVETPREDHCVKIVGAAHGMN